MNPHQSHTFTYRNETESRSDYILIGAWTAGSKRSLAWLVLPQEQIDIMWPQLKLRLWYYWFGVFFPKTKFLSTRTVGAHSSIHIGIAQAKPCCLWKGLHHLILWDNMWSDLRIHGFPPDLFSVIKERVVLPSRSELANLENTCEDTKALSPSTKALIDHNKDVVQKWCRKSWAAPGRHQACRKGELCLCYGFCAWGT